jgi:pumilio RNA-binding family
MGATAVAGGLFLDDDLCADPDYQSYYYSNAHLNRLPPPHKHLNPCLPPPHLNRN